MLLKHTDTMTYDALATSEVITGTIVALTKRGVTGITVENRTEALEYIKSLIPPSASVMNGSSRTLEEIGFIEYLKSGTHGWTNLHEEILLEKEDRKSTRLNSSHSS